MKFATAMISIDEMLSALVVGTDCLQAAICALAEAHRDPNLYQRMEEVVYAPRVKPISEILQQAQRKAVFPESFNIDLASDALYGAVWYKVLIRFETVGRG